VNTCLDLQLHLSHLLVLLVMSFAVYTCSGVIPCIRVSTVLSYAMSDL